MEIRDKYVLERRVQDTRGEVESHLGEPQVKGGRGRRKVVGVGKRAGAGAGGRQGLNGRAWERMGRYSIEIL